MSRRRRLAVVGLGALGWTLLIWSATVAAPAQPPAYHRAEWKHWVGAGTWTGEWGTCRATVRDAVLRRDSRSLAVKISVGKDGQCRLDAYEIVDPYQAQALLLDPSEVPDVDHVIPLGYAARHGGQAWPPERKEAYANDLTYRWHLAAVSASANRAKGDKGPSEWIPANRATWCWYGQAWATISVRWSLRLAPEDATAIRALTDTCR